MPAHLITVDSDADPLSPSPNVEIITATAYLRQRPAPASARSAAPPRLINLCDDYSYLGQGYYCSLLAEARGQRVIPGVNALLDLYYKRLHKPLLTEINERVAKGIKAVPGETPVRQLDIFFGTPCDPAFKPLARRLFDDFRCPLLRASLRYRGHWEVTGIEPLALKDVAEEHRPLLRASLEMFMHYSRPAPRRAGPAKYRLGLLHNPKEHLPPSKPKALAKFVQAGAGLDVDVEMITPKDYHRLASFDALFIRETTGINHHTFRFAKRAEALGLPVMDDPQSIVRCTNKVYLADLLKAHNVPAPHTVIFGRGDLRTVEAELKGYPVVLKIPDGSFSRGVHKAHNRTEFFAIAKQLLEDSELILAQEFVQTAFDWRIGVLNRQPLFVCQYFMAKNHWQIVKHEGNNTIVEGRFSAFTVDDAPRAVIDLAVRAAGLIGDGLYGVDLKQTATGLYIIEVNDNPNIDAGVEDKVPGDALYDTIIREFIRRIEAKR